MTLALLRRYGIIQNQAGKDVWIAFLVRKVKCRRRDELVRHQGCWVVSVLEPHGNDRSCWRVGSPNKHTYRGNSDKEWTDGRPK